MIRRDYLLRMIEQCVQALTRILDLARRGELDLARTEVNQAMRELAGLDLARIQTLSDAELIAHLLQGEPTQILRQKCMLLVALLHQAGELAATQGKTSESQACYLKALNLQLDVLLRDSSFDFPEFVPRVEAVLGALQPESVPPPTTAALMQYYERTGQFAKAEDALYTLLDSQTPSPPLVEFGIQLYQRLLRQTDEALEAGNLPRVEVEAGLAELKSR